MLPIFDDAQVIQPTYRGTIDLREPAILLA
jgi:hypothetical protein